MPLLGRLRGGEKKAKPAPRQRKRTKKQKNPARKEIDAANRRTLNQLQGWYKQDRSVKSIRILAARTSCETCKEAAGKDYHPLKIPKLPLKGCTHSLGCRCTYVVGAFNN